MRVFPDFFTYNGGVYSCPRRINPKAGSVHSIKLLGWGSDSRSGPYWVRNLFYQGITIVTIVNNFSVL